MKRMRVFMVCLVLLAIITSQGLYSAGKVEPSKAVVSEVVNIRVSWWGGESRHVLWNKMLDIFEQQNPNIKVSREFTDYNAYWDRLATQTAGGNAPDVIMQVMHKFAEYAKRGQMMELDPLIKERKIDLSDWGQGIIDSGKFNGKTYMVSYGNTSNAIIYNKTILDSIGVSVSSFMTWEQFEAKANEIQKKLPSGIWAIEDLGGYDYFFANWCLSQGLPGLYTSEGQLAYNRDNLITWFSMWDRMRKTGVTPPPSIQAEYPSERPEQTMIARGKVTMFVKPLNQLPSFQTATTDNLQLISVPSAVRSGQDLGGAYISLNAKTQHLEEALKLLNFFITSKDAADIMGVEYGPMGSDKMNTYLQTKVTPAQKVGVAFMQTIAAAINVPAQPPAGSNEVTNYFNLAYESVAFGKKTISAAVDDFLNEAKRILQ